MHKDEAALYKKLVRSIDESKKFHYNPHYFSQMMADLGPLDACKKLLKSGPHYKQSGFSKLWEAGRLNLSVEAIALSSEFTHLFTEQERATARKRLDDVGYQAVAGTSR